MVKWLILPLLVGLLLPVFALSGSFEYGWFVGLFALISIPTLLIWSRLTYRVDPSIKSLAVVDDLTLQVVGTKLVSVFYASMSVSVLVVLGLFYCLLDPSTSSLTLPSLIIGLLIWTRLIKSGFCNLICNHSIPNIQIPSSKSAGLGK